MKGRAMERRTFLLLAASAGVLHMGCAAETEREIDVRALGAEGDGASDDSDAIEHALRLASGTRGAVVLLPAGTYVVRRTLAVRGQLTLRGDGVGRTTVRFDGPAVQMTASEDTVLVLERISVAGGEPFAA